MAIAHEPVLVKEILELLAPKPNGIYVDATLGNAGHALAVLEETRPKGFLFGCDRDLEILNIAKERLKVFEDRVQIVQANFAQIGEVLKQKGFKEVDGIYADLGVSSWQLDTADRGFSFRKTGPIDMRMDSSRGMTAFEKIKNSDEGELTQILREYGEERYAAKIAKGLLAKMNMGELNTTLDVADICFHVYPPKDRYKKIHPATRTFQALRIWINEELDCLNIFLSETPRLLKKDGRLCVISYHSLEDRIVKHTFREFSKQKADFEILTKKPLRPSQEEIEKNSRARSAKLRGLVRVH